MTREEMNRERFLLEHYAPQEGEEGKLVVVVSDLCVELVDYMHRPEPAVSRLVNDYRLVQELISRALDEGDYDTIVLISKDEETGMVKETTMVKEVSE